MIALLFCTLVASVRVVITKYWGIGGGLNEVQVYGGEP